jgi:hypothetical protein
MADYADYEVQRAPAWLRGPLGSGWLSAHGYLKDALVEGARQAVRARFVTRAPVDALPVLASERSLERMPPDTEAAWRARLGQAWELWAYAGTRKGVREALERTGYATSVVVYDALEWPTGPGAVSWAVFWVVLSGHDWVSDGVWSDPGVWGDGGTWGSTATPDEVARVQRLILLWKPAHARCAGVIVLLSGEVWGVPLDGLWGDPGTWGGTSAVWLLPDE